MSTPTTASKWQSSTATEIVELPSGNVAELKTSFSVFQLARKGVLDAETLREVQDDDPDVSIAISFNDTLVAEVFVTPRVVLDEEDLDEDSILIDDLSDEDMQFVVERTSGGAADTAQFRGSAGGDANGNGDSAGSAGVGDDS